MTLPALLTRYTRLGTGLNNTCWRIDGYSPAIQLIHLFADPSAALGSQQGLRERNIELDNQIIAVPLESRVRLFLNNECDSSIISYVCWGSLIRALTVIVHSHPRYRLRQT